MPFKRRTFSRSNYRRRGGSNRNFVSKVKQVINSSSETKTSITPVTSTYGTSGTNINCTLIGQGTDQYQRVGNAIKLRSMTAHLHCVNADAFNFIRFVFYIPKDKDALFPSTINYHTALDFDDWTILKDVTIKTDTYNPTKTLHFSMPLRARVGFNGPGTGAVNKNPIFLYIVSDSSAIAHPAVNGYVRLNYKDM